MTTKIVLSAPLPRVYEETGNGRVAAMAAVAGQPSTLIGGDFKVEELTRISKETVRAFANACRTSRTHSHLVCRCSECGPPSVLLASVCTHLLIRCCASPPQHLCLAQVLWQSSRRHGSRIRTSGGKPASVLQARKLDTEVLAPMSRWNSAFHTVEVRPRDLPSHDCRQLAFSTSQIHISRVITSGLAGTS